MYNYCIKFVNILSVFVKLLSISRHIVFHFGMLFALFSIMEIYHVKDIVSLYHRHMSVTRGHFPIRDVSDLLDTVQKALSDLLPMSSTVPVSVPRSEDAPVSMSRNGCPATTYRQSQAPPRNTGRAAAPNDSPRSERATATAPRSRPRLPCRPGHVSQRPVDAVAPVRMSPPVKADAMRHSRPPPLSCQSRPQPTETPTAAPARHQTATPRKTRHRAAQSATEPPRLRYP